jgi:tRNA-splicing ligase RtcB
MKVFECVDGVPVLSWCENPEQGAIEQAFNVAKLPFIRHRLCLMPDTHWGYGMPIGGVAGLDQVISPNMVGVDIGCGMVFVRSNLQRSNFSTEILKQVMGKVRETIPVGFSKHSKPQCSESDIWGQFNYCGTVINQESQNALKQVGTLGGGNHFIEFQYDENGFICVMIHSGSRNLGKMICDRYNSIAKDLNSKWFSSVDPKSDLAFLPFYSQEGQQYFEEMKGALTFASKNRNVMISRTMEILQSITKCDFSDVIDIHHNYAAYENHGGMNLLIHRKGATSARAGEIGIIPGSQGTASYIVEGLGNEKSFMSCSHGAGRKMGRREACRSLDLKTEVDRLNSLGILHAIRGKDDLEEAAGAYKDIDVVMKEQEDLVKIVHTLHPIGVIKG